MGQCLSRLIESTPRELWVDAAASIDAAFAEADTLAKRHVEEPERKNMVGQLRHARLEANWRRDAGQYGLQVRSPHTSPRGGRFSVVSANNLHILRSNVQAHRGPPRPSKFRQSFAALNAWLSPLQGGLFEPTVEPSTVNLCAMLVVTAQPQSLSALPAWVGVGFPHQSLRTWAEIVSIVDILAAYHDVDTDAGRGVEAPVEIRDIAVPVIRRRSEG